MTLAYKSVYFFNEAFLNIAIVFNLGDVYTWLNKINSDVAMSTMISCCLGPVGQTEAVIVGMDIAMEITANETGAVLSDAMAVPRRRRDPEETGGIRMNT